MVKRLSGLLLALSIVGVAACQRPWDGASSATSVVAPRAAQEAAYRTGSGVTLLLGEAAEGIETQTIVLSENGGKLTLGPNSLTIPFKAVDEDVRWTFTLKSLPYLAADLHAVRVSDGTPITTFNAPLALRLSYARSPTPIPDPRLLSIYWVDGGTVLGVQKTSVDRKGQTVYTTLTHFSEYSPGLDATE